MASCAVPPSLDAVLQLAAIETVVLAADVIDRLDLWNVIGRIDHEMLDAVLAHDPARGAVGDAAGQGDFDFGGEISIFAKRRMGKLEKAKGNG